MDVDGVPDKFDVKTTIATQSGPMRDTPEYERIRRGHVITETGTDAGTARLVSYLSAKTGGTRYALDFDLAAGEWRVTSYDLLVGAQVDYSLAVQALTELAQKPSETAS